MQQKVSACNCGNIKVKGVTLRPTCKPNIPPTERIRFAKCQSCVVVNQKSIDIDNLDVVIPRTYSHVCTDMICGNCGATFRLFCARESSTAFVGRVQVAAEAQQQFERKEAIPPSVLKLVCRPVKKRPPENVVSEDTMGLDNDADLDMMFGNRADPVVGSYKHNMVLPSGELDAVISEVAPKSYFA